MEEPVSETEQSETEAMGNGTTPRAFFDEFVSRLPDPAVVVDSELTVLAVNDALCDLVTVPPVEVIGCRLTALFADVSPERIAASSGPEGDVVRTACKTVSPERVVEFSFREQTTERETVYLGVGRDATERERQAETLEQYERIFETIEDGIYTLDDSFTIGTVNSAIKSMTGYDESELVGSNATLLADESTLDEAIALTRQIQSGERDVGTLTTELTTVDGDSIPIETRFSVYTHCDGTVGQVGVVRDISDRRQFAEMLASLHDSTRQLLRAGTREEVATIITETATEVLDLDTATIHLFDRSENVLRPIGTSGTTEAATPVAPGDGVVWDVFVEGEQRSRSPAETYWPLCDQGVFYAASADQDDRVRELVDLLVASAEAALARVDRESALREREAESRRQNDQLRRLKQVNEIIRRVDRVLVEADTCTEIERAVCEELTESQWFSFSWLGRSTGQAVEPRAWAGRSAGYLDTLNTTTAGEGGPPSVVTARSGEPTVVDSFTDDLRDGAWRTEALSRDFQSAISVPLAYDDFLHGVLTVYADQPERFGGMLESVLVELGESIANAIREVQSRHRQPTDSAIELDLTVTSEQPLLVQLARRLDAPVTCDGGVPSDGQTTRLFVRVPDLEPEEVRERVGSMRSVESVSSVAEDGRYEIIATGPTLVRTLVDQGAQPGELTATATGVEITVQLAATTDVRTFVEQLESRYDGVTMHARREQPRHGDDGDSLRAALETRLTDRQLEVLQTAYLSGFFEWPRETTGEEVADLLDITQPTVNRHLRVSERKLLDLLFDA